MKELFYNGLELEKDVEFCKIMQELEENPHVLLLSDPEPCLIHHMVREHGVPWKFRNTGETHVGYRSHFVTFAYEGFVFYVEAAPYYPFTDKNFPGRYNFIAHIRVGRTQRVQCSYFEAYEGIQSISEWVEAKRPMLIENAPVRNIDYMISENYAKQIFYRVFTHGGAREKEIVDSTPWFLPTETWNYDHKVVRIVSDNPDPDGRRDAFEFDLVTQTICG